MSDIESIFDENSDSDISEMFFNSISKDLYALFQVMLQTSQAQFHIGFLNPRWFISFYPDLRNRPFCTFSKFNVELETPFSTTDDFFDSTNNFHVRKQQYASFSQQQLYYANVQGLVKQTNQIAYRTCVQ